MKHHVARPFIGSGIDTRRRTVRDVRLRVIAELTAFIGVCIVLVAAVDGFGG